MVWRLRWRQTHARWSAQARTTVIAVIVVTRATASTNMRSRTLLVRWRWAIWSRRVVVVIMFIFLLRCGVAARRTELLQPSGQFAREQIRAPAAVGLPADVRLS